METKSTVLLSATQESANVGLNRERNLAGNHRGSTSLVRPGPVVPKGSNSKLAIVFLIISCLLMGVQPAVAQEIPSGTIELSGGSVAAGIGYTWGDGTLIFEGRKYPIKVQGLSIVHVGVSDYTASGTVYNLKKPSDINGVYTALSAGAALAGGASTTAMENSNGVVIQMVATHAGVNLSLGPKGMTVSS
jgi:hypothetical protein